MMTTKAKPAPIPAQPSSRWLSIPQVADELGVTSECIRKLIGKRRIAVLHIGRNTCRIARAELDRFIRDSTIRATANDNGDE